MPMNDLKAGVFSWIPGVFWWKAGVYFIKSNEYQNRSSLDSFLILVTFNYTYIWFSFIPFTHLFIYLIFCWFLWRVWRARSFGLTQVIVRSFLLKEKNQKFKAASAELLRLFVTLCAPQTRLRLRQRRSGRSTSFLRLTLTRTRPKQLKIDDWQWTIFFFSFIYPWNLPCNCRGVALLRLLQHNRMDITMKNIITFSHPSP